MQEMNPYTWVHVKRRELRLLANFVGNKTLSLNSQWPQSGEGRAIKDTTESIARRTNVLVLNSTINIAFDEIKSTISDLKSIINNDFFVKWVSHSKYRDEKGRSFHLGQYMAQVIEGAEKYISDYYDSLPPPLTPAERAIKEAGDLAPEQKIGPVKFEIAAGVLRILHQPAATNRADANNAEAARRELLHAADGVLKMLIDSNQDRRLVDFLIEMTERIEAKQDIIQLGLASITFQLTCDIYQEELPHILSARLQAFAVGVGMYAAQFPEWIRFSENAALAEFSPADVDHLFQTGVKLVEELRGVPEAVDPEVPKTLAFLLEAIRDPRRARKRTVFAAVRTIENLVSAVLKSCGAVFGGLTDGLKAGVSIAATSALLIFAANAAAAISPAAAQILQSSWLERAGTLILDSVKGAR